MGLFDFFKKTPNALAERAEALFDSGQFAGAVREYEKALERNRKFEPFSEPFEKKTTEKIARAKNALAGQHLKNAEELMDSGCFDDARELLNLALELCGQEPLRDQARKLLEEIRESEKSRVSTGQEEEVFDPDSEEFFMNPEDSENEEDYAAVLIHSLSPEEQEAYWEYGDAFIEGFVALNQGDFNTAKQRLETSLEEHRGEKTHIPLELATCYLNLGAYEKAKPLLESFMGDFPLSLRAYPVFCETLWGLGEYDLALKKLTSCPHQLAETPLIALLTGETLVEAQRPSEAVKVYEEYLEKRPDEEMIIRALAGTLQAMGQHEKARDLYGMLLDNCRNCHRKPDSELKRRYADAAYKTGLHTVAVLEIYLDLAEGDPDRRKEYYRKVSEIYGSMGNEAEAKRFDAFSEKSS
jgi:tetratricopeptide (TPR) repeat protein